MAGSVGPARATLAIANQAYQRATRPSDALEQVRLRQESARAVLAELQANLPSEESRRESTQEILLQVEARRKAAVEFLTNVSISPFMLLLRQR